MAGAPADAAPSAAQKIAAPPAQKPSEKDKPKPTPAPARTAAKSSPAGSNRWRDRGYISGNFGWQASSTTFSDTRTLSLATGDTESRHMTTSYEVKAGPMFDIGAGIRLVKNLGVAVSVTRFSLSNDIGIDATVPHPFFFNTQRPVTGTTPGTREELAIHLDAVYVIPGKKLQVAIFGGPTFFNAKQTVVSDFTYNDVYPFDAPPTFTAGISAEESKSVTGFNAGVDIGYFFNPVFGVGGVVRFSRGTLASSIGDLDVGGPQFSAGVRIRLRQGAPSTKAKTPPPPKKK
jgi:outer membrane protein with beta-barrel domain